MTMPNPADVAGAVAAGLGKAKEVVGLVPGADAASSLIDGVVAVRRWISDRHNWTRVLWFGAGAVLLVIGGTMLAGRPISKAVAPVASAVVTKGKGR